MRFKEMLSERVSFNNWQKMDDKALRHEYDIEYTIKPLKGMLGDVWPSFGDFKRAYQKGKVVSVTPAFDRKIGYRSRTRSRDQIISLIKGYASYPKFRNEKTIDGIFAAFENNEPMNMPIVLDLGDGSYRIMGGNTRMDIAMMLGITPKVMVIPAYETISEDLDEKTGFVEIAESLNTPQEYWMTEDTALPHSIYAAFQIDGEDYSVSLLKSGKSNIYIAELNRIVNVNKRLWSFKKTSHIRPAISTFVRIIESSIPFIMPHMHGIAMPVPKGVASPRFNTMLSRVMKRVLIQKFAEVPVQYNENHKGGKSYMFAIRKGMSPEKVFKTKAYWGYDFNTTEKKVIPVDALDELEPAKRPVKHPTMEPHKKFQFAGIDIASSPAIGTAFEVDNTLTVASNDDLEDYDIAAKKAEEKAEKIAYQTKVVDDEVMNVLSAMDAHDNIKYEFDFNLEPMSDEISMGKDVDTGNVSIINMVPALFPDMSSKLQQFGFMEEKINWGDLEYRLSEVMKTNPGLQRLGQGIFFDLNGKILDDHKERWKSLMKAFAANPKNFDVFAFNSLFHKFLHVDKKMKEAEAKAEAEKQKLESIKNGGNDEVHKVKMDHVKADYDLDLSTPNIDDVGMYDPEPGNHFVFRAKPGKESYQEEINHGKHWHSKYANEFVQLKKEDWDSFEKIREYTAKYYEIINQPMRRAFKYLMEGDAEEVKYIMSPSKIEDVMNMVKLINMLTPTDEAVWVYRNATIPDVKNDLAIGKDIVDPAFMSTSLKQGITMGSEGNARLTIYIPKGSIVMPITESSKVDAEREVILLPFSVIRPLEYIKSDQFGKTHVKCVYVGNGANDYLTKLAEMVGLDKKLTESIVNRLLNKMMTEDKNKNKTVYDEEMPSMKEMEKYQEAIKSGKIKLDTPKKGK